MATLEQAKALYMGKNIRIVRMDNNGGSDKQANEYNGRTGIVKSVYRDCDGDINLRGTWGGLSVNLSLDKVEFVTPDEV